MREAPKLVRSLAPLVLVAVLVPSTSAQIGSPLDWRSKLDPILQQRASLLTGRSRVIVRAVDAGSLALVLPLIQQVGGSLGRALPIVDGQAVDVPHLALRIIASSPLVSRLSLDRLVAGALERTGATVGATAVRQEFGYDGRGIGIAVVDSGITPWHDDLSEPAGGSQRVDRFVDLVNGRALPYDDYGHGAHVAGIIAGNGHDSGGARSGIAPAARLIVFKALDGSGRGRISDVIAALGSILLLRDVFDIRVVNLSLAAPVYESYNLDPLTLAARQLVAAGIVVVAAAGNAGRDPQGRTLYAGVSAPGNAPWVLTVGASSHMGTVDRADDAIAAFSSRGPAAVDYVAKPDLVAPGVGIESLSDPASRFYITKSAYLLGGSVLTPYLPYLSLSGTSMSAPVVSGTVAMLLQANPMLTPNQVKAILQYTAGVDPDYDPLTQGAGFLNARGAVELARFLAAQPHDVHPVLPEWSARVIWGNQLIAGGRLTADATAWSAAVTWGAARTLLGQTVDWGVICTTAPCGVDAGTWSRWGVTCADVACSDVTWGDGDSRNVVWGTTCGGDNCTTPWSTAAAANVLLGSTQSATLVWGTASDETLVWGTSCSDPSCEPGIWSNP
jgi:serine protease AprX